jgi:membrane associated rhomboid family serine protease
MTDPKAPPELGPSPMEVLLRYCEKARPQPWYPSAFCRESGIPRDVLDPHLDALRMSGLIRLTDWVPELGQGYVLTPAGETVVTNPHAMAALRKGSVPVVKAPPSHDDDLAPSVWDRGEAVRNAALLRPTSSPVTRTLIYLNITVFLVGWWVGGQLNPPVSLNDYLMNGDGRVFALTGGLRGVDLLRGQWWQLLTCCFVHAGLLHIGLNMYALSVLGPRAEQLWGRWRFLALYLIAGLAGSCAAMMSNPIGCVGASGAVYGLLGGEAIYLFMNWSHLPSQYAGAWLKSLIINAVLMILVNNLPNVSGAAHYGGAIGGGAAAFVLTFHRFGNRNQRRLALLGLVFLPVLSVGVLIHAMNTQLNWAALTRPKDVVAKQSEPENCEAKVMIPAHTAISAFLKLYKEGGEQNLSKKGPDRRTAEEAKALREALQERLDALTATRRRIETVGPYAGADVEKVRQLTLRLLEQCEALARLSQEELQSTVADADWRNKQRAEAAALEKVRETKDEWLETWKALVESLPQ